jgi:putative protease
MNKIELLAPAGDLEKLKIAISYGADAVYFGGDDFSLRAGAGNMTLEEISEGVEYAHQRGAKAYIALNIFPHNDDMEPIKAYLAKIKNIPIDAYIVSDPGVLQLIGETDPDREIHLSTQANATNYMTTNFWFSQGVKRIVLARELTLREIREIKDQAPQSKDLEAFIHGAMCISYSGRCLLSNFMVQRDANRGACAHPCRWNYSLVEEKRPGEYFPVEEDSRGTYLLNSRDLCMIEYIPELIKAGITSLKIEGRMKSVFYVATVVSAYRKALDLYEENPEKYSYKEEWLEEVSKVSHREFTTGFYFNKPTHKDQNYQTSSYTRDYSFVGKVRAYHPQSRRATIEQRNKIVLGDEIEVMGPGRDYFSQKIREMVDQDGASIDEAPHPQQIFSMLMDYPVEPGDILRKRKTVE